MPNISLSSLILATKNTFATLRKEGGLDDLSGQLSKLKKSRFLRDVTIVAGGTAAAQAITVAFSPVITRLYGPEAFGILGVFISIISVLTPLAGLAYAHAVVLPASDSEARTLIKLSLLIALSISGALIIILGVFHHQVAEIFGFSASSAFLFLVPAVVFLIAAERSLSQWLIRNKKFRSISTVAVTKAAAMNSFKAGFGFFLAVAPVLLFLYALGHVFQVILLWLKARSTIIERQNQPELTQDKQVTSIKKVAHTYRDFPFYRAPQLLLNAFSQNIPLLILAAFFGPIPAGFYALTRRVLVLPRALISQSVGKVFLPEITEAAHQGIQIRPKLIKTTIGLSIIGLVPFGIVILFGPQLFGFVFGAEWISSGEYARWLAVWLFFGFINVPSVQAIPLLGLQKQFLSYEIFVTIIRAGTLIFGAVVLNSDLKAIASFSVAGAILYLGLIVYVIYNSNRRHREGLYSYS